MNKTIMSTGLSWIWLALVVLVLDFGSKQWVVMQFSLGETVPVISFINFTYVHNPGAAFSFLADRGGWQRWAFSAIAVAFTVVLLVKMYNLDKRAKLPNITYAMIIGGALGNLFDRMKHGVVIDFIDFYVGHWHWPTFNVADVSICIGAVLTILEFFLLPRR
ncbi:signal peptidase II [Candidatus Doolittlea endobia]|uniref:Lipoprotein signal peptidase n=1 Tax=Candidatus Doolittlea endobia TaxID=1778262 RepID=A0A143WS12_9ENTR|nr:signal peptidase II [Candidatus Doolittlea endobia]CUX96473.1 Lipoprotein signal peptidase [Candidatus Doolittlea endobia]